MNAVGLAIKVTADAKDAVGGLNQVEQSTSKVQKAGKLAGRALAAGLAIAAVAGVKAVKAAQEDAVAQAGLANALKNATGARAADVASVESWITAQGKALGVSDSELRPAMESLVTATKDVGKAQDLAAIAMDISARKGVALETVAKSLAKAQATGSVGALAKYGVATKDADGKTRSLSAVQRDLAKAYKGAAAANPALEQKKLSVAVDELQEKFGAKLLPALEKATAAGIKVIDWIDRNNTAALAIVVTLGSLLAIVKGVSAATQIWSAVTKAYTAVQWLLNAAMSANPVGLIVIAIVALVAGLVLAYKKSETFRRIVDKAFGAVANKVGVVVGFIKKHWKTLLAILTGPIGIAVRLITGNWDKIKAGAFAVIGWVKSKWTALKTLITQPFKDSKRVIDAVWEDFKTGFGVVKARIVAIAQDLRDKLSAAFNAIKAPIQGLINMVQGVIDRIQKLIDKIKNGLPSLDNPFNRIAARGGLAAQNAGKGGSLSGGGGGGGGFQIITVNVKIPLGFVGSERQLATEMKRILGHDLRRLRIAS